MVTVAPPLSRTLYALGPVKLIVKLPPGHVVGLVTELLETAPLPVLATFATVWILEAAAICAGLVSTTERPAVAPAVDETR